MVRVVYGAGEGVLAVGIPVLKANPVGWLGPYYMGAAVDSFFLGVLACQVSTYFSDYPRDSKWNKVLVVTCTVLSIFKGMQSIVCIWGRNIVGFGNWHRAVELHWVTYMEPFSMVLLATTAQSYFTWRCFKLTGRNWLLLVSLGTIMASVVALGLALSLQLAYDPFYYPTMRNVSIPLLTLGLLVDVAITSTALYRLVRLRQCTNRKSGPFLDSWITLTWQCALPPAVAQAVNLAVFVLASQRNVWYAFCNMVTPRLYVVSLMYTLNARRNITIGPSEKTAGFSSKQGRTRDPLGERRGFERTEIVTLSTFEAKQPAFILNTRESCTSQPFVPRETREVQCCGCSSEAPDTINNLGPLGLDIRLSACS